MSDFLIGPTAAVDLEEIWNYYGAELKNPDTADRIIGEIFSGFRKIAVNPALGHIRRDLAQEPVRFHRVRRFLIIYRIEDRPIQIVRVLHGARDVRSLLNE